MQFPYEKSDHFVCDICGGVFNKVDATNEQAKAEFKTLFPEVPDDVSVEGLASACDDCFDQLEIVRRRRQGVIEDMLL